MSRGYTKIYGTLLPVPLSVLPETWFLLAAVKRAGLCSQDSPKPGACFLSLTHFTAIFSCREMIECKFVSSVSAEDIT